jgi:hypothetical protein
LSLKCVSKLTLLSRGGFEEERRVKNMKGKVLSIITAILFGASMMVCPIVGAAATDPAASTDVAKPAKTTKKKTPKKTTKKKAAPAKKKTGKTKAAEPKTKE